MTTTSPPKHRGPIGTPRTIEIWANRAWRAVPEGVEAHAQLVVEGFGGPEVVCTWPLENLAKLTAAFAEECFELATGDAESRGARTAYVLRVVNVVDNVTTYASRNLRIDPPSSSASAGVGVESASAAGLVAQLMRHNEGLVKQVVLMSERTTRAMSESMLALAERTAELERENMKLARKMREQEVNEGEQAALVIDAEKKAKREEKIFDLIEKQAAAQAMAKLGMKPALPAKPPAQKPTANGKKGS